MSDDLLMQYSEWLDSQGLIVEESDFDRRTHEELVADFLLELDA